MLWLLVIGAVLIGIALVIGGANRDSSGFRAQDYRAKPLLSPWEARVLMRLRSDLPAGYYACPQVRLADMLAFEEVNPARQMASIKRVASKSVDFAIINEAGAVELVIELDDRSHFRPERRRRDEMVAAVLEQCAIPLMRVRPGQRIDMHRIAQLLA